jgi:hypothetical protein
MAKNRAALRAFMKNLEPASPNGTGIKLDYSVTALIEGAFLRSNDRCCLFSRQN